MKQIIADDSGVILTAIVSDVRQEGAIIVDADTFADAAGNLGRRRWVDGVLTAYEPPSAAVTVADVARERDRRLSFGFDYDFGDARGIHHIATAAEDMRKWMDEVNPLAQTLINAGQPGGEIAIVTETGPVTITAGEWQSILLAAGEWRQPIYAAYFALKVFDPIPADFAEDTYWPA